MRAKVILPMLLLTLCVVSQPVRAQLVDLSDERTAEQKWNRSIYLIDFVWMSWINYAKSMDQTAEDVGRFVGEVAGPSWGEPGSRTLASYVRGHFRNLNLYENLEFEVVSESEAEIRCRMNIPYASRFGETGESDGVTLQEYIQVWNVASEAIADYLGFDMTHEVGGDWIEFTVKTR